MKKFYNLRAQIWVYSLLKPTCPDTMLEIYFFVHVASICYLVYKAVAKLTHIVANTGGRTTIGWVTIHCQIYDETNFHKVKGIDNAFDRMELCFVLYAAELFQ